MRINSALKEIKVILLPFLFSVSMSWWVMNSFFGQLKFIAYGTILVLHILIFFGFVQASKSKYRLCLFLVSTILYIGVTLFLLKSTQDTIGTVYMLWLASADTFKQDIEAYCIGTMLFTSFMFSSVVFYFGLIHFRIGLLFMTGLIPLIIQSAKNDAGITMPFVLFVIFFFALYILQRRTLLSHQTKENCSENGWWPFASGMFIFLVLGLSIILPKPSTSPRLAAFDSLVYRTIRPLIHGGGGEDVLRRDIYSLNMENDASDLNTAFIKPGDRILFRVEASDPLYLRVQSRDKYEKNQWFTGNEALTIGYPPEAKYRRYLTLDALSSLLRSLEETDLRQLGFQRTNEILNQPSVPRKKSTAKISMNQVKTDCFIYPYGMYRLETVRNRDVWMNDLGFCYPGGTKPLGIYESYKLDYISSVILPSSIEMGIVRQMNKDIFEGIDRHQTALFQQFDDPSKEKEDAKAEIMAILHDARVEMEGVYENYIQLPQNMPQRIYQLAQSITAHATSDYQKALAIENFFHTSGFLYDTSPPRVSTEKDINDYFLFECRKGFCIHFASAMVVLARACGLPARYTEGFVADEYEEQTGCYVVRESDAHAYPEIYIAGYGWMAFEPTVSDLDRSSILLFWDNLIHYFNRLLSNIQKLIQSAPIAIKLLFIPVFIFAVFYTVQLIVCQRYRSWQKKMMKSDRNKALNMLFIRIVTLLKKVELDINKFDTPSTYASRVLMERRISINKLADAMNKTKYGGYRLSYEEFMGALEEYKTVVSEVKAKLGKHRAWLIQ